MTTDTEPPDAQARARLRDLGVVLTSLGLFGLCFPPPTHAQAILHNRVYLASALLMLVGAVFLALWAILAARSRRERSRRGFPVVPAERPKNDTIFP
jgi:hypothetical protein